MSGAAFAAALSGLPGMGPATLVSVLERWNPPDAWAEVCAGRIERPGSRTAQETVLPLSWPTAAGEPGRGPFEATPRPSRRRPAERPWPDIARRIDPVGWWEGVSRRGVSVTWWSQPDYPRALAGDPQPPGVIFWRGDLSVLDRPCVAIVGTRNATPDGRAVAFEMGRDLAGAGVCVVSGLALGIDGAAHAGALRAVEAGGAAGPAGVAASGVDVPYPRRHAGLWDRVVGAGVVISENLPGRPAQAWRFPSRNRVIAGLVRMVVVVESHSTGGSLITAEAAIERGVDVRVVPGPVHSPASAGSNQLLYDGPGPVRHARDVLDAIGLLLPASRPEGPRGRGPNRVLQADQKTVLAAVGRRPVTAGQVMTRSGLDAGTAGRILDELSELGLVRQEAGWWCRCG